MSGAARLPFEEVLRGCGDGPLELLSQICSGPLLAAFTIFRDGDARRFGASGDEIYRDFCGLLRGDGLAAFFARLPLTPMNSDQWRLLKRGSVPSGKLPSVRALGVTPKPLDLFLERWMLRYRKSGRFANKSFAPEATYSAAARRSTVREDPRGPIRLPLKAAQAATRAARPPE